MAPPTTKFNYDILTLIELVENRPCLWDRTNEDYKNKSLRDFNWREVCDYLEERYEDLDEDEKKKTAQIITNKWNNIRDAFIRSLNTKSGQPPKKPYVYYENLKFLLKVAKNGETDYNIAEETAQEQEVFATDECTTDEPKKVNHKRKINSIEAVILNELKNKNTKAPEDDFFTSFIPYVMDMSESEKIQLHMELLSSIAKIKQNRVDQEAIESSLFMSPAPGSSTLYPKKANSIPVKQYRKSSKSVKSESPDPLTPQF